MELEEHQSFDKKESSPIAQKTEPSPNKSRLEDSQLVKNLTQGESQEEINITLVMNQGYYFILNNDQTPFAQIAFVDDCYPKYNGKMGLENFLQMKNIQSVPWTTASDFVEKVYASPEERELAQTYLKKNMRDSRQLQTLDSILNETVDRDWHEMVVENPLSMNLRGIEMIQEMLLEDLVFLALRLFLQQGFDQSFDNLSVFLKIQPLQLILAFVDCFPSYGDLVYQLVMKQGIIQRSMPKSKSSNTSNVNANQSQIQQRIGVSQLQSGQHTPIPLTHVDAEYISSNRQQTGFSSMSQNINFSGSFNPDQNFATYIQSFIRFAQSKREGENQEEQVDLIDAEGRIQLLKEIIQQLDCSLPLILKQLGVKERQSNDFLKKQFIQQIKNIRTCIKNQDIEVIEEKEEETQIVDRIQSEVDIDEYSLERSYQDALFYADREDEVNYQQQQQVYNVPQKINFEQHRLEAWNLLYDKIKQGAPLSKYEEDQWRYFAFENALITLGEKVLIQDQDIQSAVKCYQILFCLGHKQSSTILYSLLCLTKQYSQAYALIMNTNLNIEERRQAIDLISRNCKTSTQIGSKLQFCYQLSSVLPKQSKYLAALTAFQILNKNSSNAQDISLIFKLFILGKLVQKGLYFQQSDSDANKIFNYILSTLKPVFIYEYITIFFVKQAKEQIQQKKNNALQQGTLTNSKTISSTQRNSVVSMTKTMPYSKFDSNPSTTKSMNSTVKQSTSFSSAAKTKTLPDKPEKSSQTPWDQFDIRVFLDKEHQKFYNIIHNINTDHETRRDYHIAHTLGTSILFKSDKEYDRSYFDENKGRIIRQNQRICKLLSDFQNPTMMWPLNLVKPNQEKSEIQYQNNEQAEQPQQIDFVDETPQNKDSKRSNIPLVKQNIKNDGNFEFEGRLVKELPAKLNEDEVIMHKEEKDVKRKLGHFTINNQIFSKWLVKPKYLQTDAQDANFKNLGVSVSPYFLNIYAASFADSSIYCEPYLCTYDELCQNKLLEYNVDEEQSGKLIKEISGLFQLVSLCVSLHNSELYGYLSFFGKNILLIDNEGFIKTPNFLVLVDGNFELDWNTIPHELLLEEGSQQEMSKCDVWAIGSLMVKLFYGKNIVQESTPQNQVDQYLQDMAKFKTQEHLDTLFADCNIEQEQNSNSSSSQRNSKNKNPQNGEEQNKRPQKYFDVSQMNFEFRWLLENIIRKCMRYEAVSRPSALELLLEIHEFIKKSNPEGIFTLYNQDSVSTKIKSLKRLQYVPIPEGQKQDEKNNEKNKKNTEQAQDQNKQQNNQNQQSAASQNNSQQDQEGKKVEQQQQNQKLSTIKEEKNEGIQQEGKENENDEAKNEAILIQNQDAKQKSQTQEQQQVDDLSSQNRKSQPDITFSEGQTPQNNKNQAHHRQSYSGDQNESNLFKNKENRPISAIQNRGSQPKNYMLDAIKENDYETSHEFSSSTQFFFIPGGSVLLRQGNKSYYFTPYNTEHHINNKSKKKDDQSLKEILIGEGRLLMAEDRVFQGYFSNFGLPHSGYMLNQFTKKTSILGFEEKTRMPKSDAEKTFVDDTKDKQEMFREQQQLNKVIQLTNNLYNSTKKFLDFFGNWMSCDFIGGNCVPTINNKTSPLLFITENKTLYVNGQQAKAFLFDYSIMTYSIFDELPTQGIASHSSLATEEKPTSLFDLIKLLSSSGHVTQHLLEGCKYKGGLQNWDPVEGNLSFYDTEIQVNGSAQKSLIYQTVLRFPTGDCYKGGLLNGKYWDYGRLYSNNRLVLEGKFVDNSMIYGTLYYTDDKIKYVGEVFFDENDDSYKKHGKGTLYLRNGDIYDGEFSLDLYHGFGKILYDGGNKGYFEGEFYEGLKHGPGLYCDKIKGIEFSGEYENNKRSKFGVEKIANKHEYKGNFKDGKKFGQGIIYYPSGKIKSYEGHFEEDKKHGEGIETDINGNKVHVKYWKDGILSSTVLKKTIPTQQSNRSKQENETTFYKFT